MNTKIEELKEALRKEEVAEKKLTIKNIEKECGIKIGDIVEYLYSWRINDYDYETCWSKGEVYDLSKGDKSIFVSIKGHHGDIMLDNVRIYNEYDYTLRHSIWDRELDVDDSFQLVVDKPKSTKGRIYQIYKVVKERGHAIEYLYYNDYGKLETLYDDELHVITDKF